MSKRREVDEEGGGGGRPVGVGNLKQPVRLRIALAGTRGSSSDAAWQQRFMLDRPGPVACRPLPSRHAIHPSEQHPLFNKACHFALGLLAALLAGMDPDDKV